MNGESSHIFPSYGMFAFVHAFVVSICLESNEIGYYLIQPKIEINAMISSSKLLLFCIMDWNYIVPSCISGSSSALISMINTVYDGSRGPVYLLVQSILLWSSLAQLCIQTNSWRLFVWAYTKSNLEKLSLTQQEQQEQASRFAKYRTSKYALW